MGTVTMKDVAAAVGVSVTTVSNAYNRPDRLSGELRTQILTAAHALGYSGPDAAGRALRRGRSNAYGVIYGERLSYVFTDPYANTFLAAFTEVLERAGAAITLLPAPPAAEVDIEAVQTALVDGVVALCAGPGHPAVAEAVRRGLRVTLTDMIDDTAGVYDFVAIDDAAAGAIAGRHLHDLGHRRVTVVYEHLAGEGVRAVAPEGLDDLAGDFERRGFLDSARRLRGIVAGQPGAQVDFLSCGPNRRESGRRAGELLLARPDAPTGVIAVSDIMGLGVLDALGAAGVRAGTDLSVMGFDGLPEALDAGLTSVCQATAEKGRRCAELLLDPELPERQVVLPVRLAVGSSTAPPRPDVAANLTS